MKWLLTASDIESKAYQNYARWVSGAGVSAEGITPSMTAVSPDGFDALLLTGGGDIEPARFKQAPHRAIKGVVKERDEMEFRLITQFIDAGKPVLGICRGLQVVNVFFGGRLIQHIPDILDPEKESHSASKGPDARHSLVWEKGSAMARAIGSKARECNSSHHQAADPSVPARNLRIRARSGGGIIEALDGGGGKIPFISCVQWHPERMGVEEPAGGGLRKYWVQAVKDTLNIEH